MLVKLYIHLPEERTDTMWETSEPETSWRQCMRQSPGNRWTCEQTDNFFTIKV